MDAEALLLGLRRKEGTWVAWGHACQELQRAGYSPQAIFEATGFEPIHQNQIMVAAQVYAAIAAPDTQAYFAERGSDILYTLRILPNRDRASVAALIAAQGADSETAHEIAKAVRDYGVMTKRPYGDHPGDAVAFQCWRLAKQQADLQVRSRLIAKGFKFAQSEQARRDLEHLLTDFSVSKAEEAPYLPLYRLESEEELPCMVPVVGKVPLTLSDWRAAPLIEPLPPFGVVPYNGVGAYLAIPGWKAVLAAEDPVAFALTGADLPGDLTGDFMVIADRALRNWDGNGYGVVIRDGSLAIAWSSEPPAESLGSSIIGRVILVLRPPRIFDDNATKDPWQVDE